MAYDAMGYIALYEWSCGPLVLQAITLDGLLQQLHVIPQSCLPQQEITIYVLFV
jgi:hypothetical protein